MDIMRARDSCIEQGLVGYQTYLLLLEWLLECQHDLERPAQDFFDRVQIPCWEKQNRNFCVDGRLMESTRVCDVRPAMMSITVANSFNFRTLTVSSRTDQVSI
jgi:hypothetical protein